MSNLLKGLNPAQAEAAGTKGGAVLIIAGAGSGKTRALTYRIANLIEIGVSPDSILALTFTNKAAGEMKERIASLVDPYKANRIWAGTFHSIFAKILRYEAIELGYTSDYTIYDAEDQLALIKDVMNEMALAQKDFPPQQIRSEISSAKNKMISHKQYAANADNNFQIQAGKVYEAYEARIRNSNAMDFDDLLLNIIDLFKKSRQTLEKYQDRFQYILVDEYQDTNKAQYIAIKMLAAKYGNICVVGDDAQSIYRWRGAEIQNILDFKKDYPYAKVVKLEQNYRSTKTILKAADSVIKQNPNQLPKNLWTDNPEGDKVHRDKYENDKDEANSIAERIVRIAQSGVSLNEIAVLYRTNAQALSLEQACRMNNLPYIVIGGMSFFKRKEIKDTLAYLRLLINSKDSISLQRVVNEPPRGLGQKSIEHFYFYSVSKSISLYEAFEYADYVPNLQKRAVSAAKSLTKIVSKWRDQIGSLPNAEIIKGYIDATGLPEMYREIGTDDANDRWNNIMQFIGDAVEFFDAHEEATIADYIQQISLIADIDNANLEEDRVSLMTLHSAKGLEFDVVFLCGLEHNLFPLGKAESDSEELQEERRLFYVGITRAKKQLFLTHADRRMRFGEISASRPSRFLFEIEQTVLDNPMPKGVDASTNTQPKFGNKPSFYDGLVSKPKYYSKPKTEANNYSQIPENESYSQIPNNLDYNVGNVVRHSKFGRGVITGLKGEGNMRQATVRFDSVGKKQLMIKYAGLEKVM